MSAARTSPPPNSSPRTSQQATTGAHGARAPRRGASPFARSLTRTCDWLEDVKGAKPATLLRLPLGARRAGHAVPSAARASPSGTSWGPSATARREDHDARRGGVLAAVAATGVSPRTVNKHRAIIAAIFSYGMQANRRSASSNPAAEADKRREPHRGALVYYSVEEVEALARALAEGRHREASTHEVSEQERKARGAEDQQDGEMVRVSAYAGLRLGELLALRWRDVDFAGHALTVGRAMSAGVESSTKSGRVRRRSAARPGRSRARPDERREDFTGADERVFCNPLGRTLDPSALRRRYRPPRPLRGCVPLRWHDLRHTYGSLLAAAGVDLVTIQAAMGHSALATTSRYLHARPASEQAHVFTRAFQSTAAVEAETAAA